MLLCIFLFSNKISAQTEPLDAYFNTESTFTSAPVSPNAYCCGLHTLVPCELSVGLPSIDVPVCRLEDVDISVPVTLKYHPDAVKPDEYPGWVGLGWMLQAGGSIVRINKGEHDEASGGYYDLGHSNLGFSWPSPPTPTNDNFADLEPDEFLFNFAGYSGKFYFNHLGEWVFTTNSGEHFEMTVADTPVSNFSLSGSDFGLPLNDSGRGFESFSIKTNDGTKYTFGGTPSSVEYTRTVNNVDAGDYVIFPTAWHLTSIESINGNVVNLAYQRHGAIFRKSQNFNIHNEYDCSLGCSSSPFEYPTGISDCFYKFYNSYHIIYPSYLSTITGTDGNMLEFVREDSNQENYGNITILGLSEDTYSKYPKLTNIILRRDGIIEKEMILQYNDESVTANRLMLNQVYEIDDNNNQLPGYQFDYNETQLPAYHSFEVDHWGYYNGVALFDPDAMITCGSALANPDTYIGAIEMQPNVGFTTASILEGIVSPMGSYKEFVYEQNIVFKEVQKDYNTSSSQQESYANFRLDGIATGKEVGGLRIAAINNYESQNAALLRTHAYDYEERGILDYTSYCVEQGVAGDIRYWNIQLNNTNNLRHTNGRQACYTNVRLTQADGGYRMLTYSNFDNDLSNTNTLLLDTPPLEYEASVGGLPEALRTHTAPYSCLHRERGKLLQEDLYRADGELLRRTENTYTSRRIETAYQVRCINTCYSNSGDALPTFAATNNLANARATAYYDYIYPVHLTGQQVTQYDENGENGRITTRSFEFDYTENDGDLRDDNNLRQTSIVNSDGKVYKTTYKYTTDYNVGNVSLFDEQEAGAIRQAKERNLFLPVETLRLFSNSSGASEYIIGGQITTYQINPSGSTDDIVPYQTYRLTFPDADGNLDMVLAASFSESSTDSGIFTYDDNGINADYELYHTYKEYSSTGIPKQTTQDGGTPNAIILSDDELLTMASITNAAYKDVAYTGFENYGNGNWNILTGTSVTDNPNIANDVIFGRQAFANFSADVNGLSPGVYQISFWSNGGSGAVNGFTVPVIHTATNGWTYHSIEINVGSSVNFTGIGTIDELRLHPEDALMTTYTYEPVTHLTLVSTDENGKPMFYEYDGFERVIAGRDQDGNLVQDYQYNYRQTDGGLYNFVRTHNHWLEGASPGPGTDDNFFVQNTQYMDGLGRPLQHIVTGKSPLEKDIIQINEYDTDGRQPRRYLPFTPHNQSVGTGNFLDNAVFFQETFHIFAHLFGAGQSSKAYQQTDFEASTMSRSKMIRPEGSYHNNPLEVEYNVGGLPAVKDFQIDILGNVSAVTNFQQNANGFDIDVNNTRQADENGHITISYTDKLGRSILSRKQNTDSGGNVIFHDTYTVYDNFGNVRYVVPPQAVQKLNEGFTWVGTTVQDLVYEYRYDRRQRMIYKRVPAADEEEYVYDYLDRIILVQDGNRRADQEWLFTKYDALGRVILTGLHPSTSSRSTLQASATNFYLSTEDASDLFETTTAGTTGYTLTTSFPQLFSGQTIHTGLWTLGN